MTAPAATIWYREEGRAMIEASTVERVAPDGGRPYWREESGARSTFGEVVSSLAIEAARETAERDCEAVCQLAARCRRGPAGGSPPGRPTTALAPGRLCEEVAGFWPRDSSEPMR
jgi:hypothetical protein